MAQVYIPTPIRQLTANQTVVTAQGKNVRELLGDLDRQFPGIRDRLLSGDGLRPGMAVVINGSYGSLGLLQPVPDNAEVHFLPALSGG